jgi:hypothetical protein
MFKAWFVVIIFFVASITGFLGWLVNFEKYYDYSFNGKTAIARMATETWTPGEFISVDGETRYKVHLRYELESGDARFVSPYFPRHVIEKIQNDGTVEIIYLSDNPLRVIYKGDELPMGLMHLLLGIVAGIIALYLMKNRLRLVPYVRYLGGNGSDGDNQS